VLATPRPHPTRVGESKVFLVLFLQKKNCLNF
jgi:hypothetical protein